MKKLTERQLAALTFIAETPGKSGGFYADFGHLPTTLSSLHHRKLLETDDVPLLGAPIFRARWRPTDTGRAALSKALGPDTAQER